MNDTNLQIKILHMISNDLSFRTFIENSFRPIFADYSSFLNNPNCSCKNKVITFVISNQELFIEKLRIWEVDHPSLEIPDHKGEDIGGKVFNIKKTTEDFNIFFEKVKKEKYAFKAFSILEKDDSWTIFFL